MQVRKKASQKSLIPTLFSVARFPMGAHYRGFTRHSRAFAASDHRITGLVRFIVSVRFICSVINLNKFS